MNIPNIYKQIADIKEWGLRIIFYKIFIRVGYLFAIPIVIFLRLISPWVLIRIIPLIDHRIGHFAANTELYLCDRTAKINQSKKRYFDIFYMGSLRSCNEQLAMMWRRALRVYPTWLLYPVMKICSIIPGGNEHVIWDIFKHSDRDVHLLYESLPCHLTFTDEEKILGEENLRKMGIPASSRYVCLIVRDSAYLPRLSYHSYRDSDVTNYYLAAEELTKMGYFVIRMGAKVNNKMLSDNPMIIDYATNGMRTEFLDIYLGAYCEFCITTSTGWDAIPMIFRRPLCFVGFSPVGHYPGFLKRSIGIFKHHVLVQENRELTLDEIFMLGVGYCLATEDYSKKAVQLVENSPEEIRDLVIEMVERLNGTKCSTEEDQMLQEKFLECLRNIDWPHETALHNKQFLSRIGTSFVHYHAKLAAEKVNKQAAYNIE